MCEQNNYNCKRCPFFPCDKEYGYDAPMGFKLVQVAKKRKHWSEYLR